MQGSADIVALEEARSRRAAAEGEPVSLDDAGAMLRAARTGAGLSVRDVEASINIKAERLEAIEAMDIARLPAQPYTLGFVRTYAEFLDLPSAALVSRFREEAGWAEKAAIAPKIAPPPRELKGSREASLLAVLLVVGLLLWLGWQVVQSTAPDEEVALEGFPLADRSVPRQVTYEVRSGEGAPKPTTTTRSDASADAAPAPAAPVRVPTQAQREDVATVGTETEAARDVAPSEAPLSPQAALVPRVLRQPSAARQDEASPGEAASERVAAVEAEVSAAADPVTASAPAGEPVAAAAEAATPEADDLNTRALIDSFEQDVAELEREAAEAAAAGVLPQTTLPPLPTAEPVRTAEVRAAPTPTPSRIVPAELTKPVSPVYPRRCENRADDEEVVTVAFDVSRFGKVTGPKVSASTNKCFDRAALAAVSRFGFDPARQDGQAITTSGRSTRIVFRKP